MTPLEIRDSSAAARTQAARSSGETQAPVAVLCGDLNMLRCFAGLPVETLVAVSDPKEVTLHSRYCRRKTLIASPLDGERAVSDLLRLGQSFESRAVLFYGTDALLLLISRNRKQLERYFRFRMPDAALVEELVDKQSFAELAVRKALPVPASLPSSAITSARDVESRIGLPCIIKPSVHVGWFRARAEHGLSPHKALLMRTARELQSALDELRAYCPSYVVQRYIPGGEDEIYSYHAYLNARCEPLGEFLGKKLRTYPKQAGVSTYLELTKNDELLALGRQIVKRLGLIGPVKLDFKRSTENGVFYLLEINPRFTLWNYLGAVSGVNLPALAYADLASQPWAAPQPYRTSTRWLSFGNDLRAFLRDYRGDGSLSLVGWLSSYCTPKVYDVWSWRDPMPLVANSLKFSRAAYERARRSVRAR